MLTDSLTPNEVAALLDVSERTVRRWCGDGTLRASRLRTRYRVPRSEVNRLLKQGTAPATASHKAARRSRRAAA